MIDQLLTEKLRPKEIRHMILPDRIRSLFDNKGLNHNVLLAGSPMWENHSGKDTFERSPAHLYKCF